MHYGSGIIPEVMQYRHLLFMLYMYKCSQGHEVQGLDSANPGLRIFPKPWRMINPGNGDISTGRSFRTNWIGKSQSEEVHKSEPTSEAVFSITGTQNSHASEH